MSLTGSLAWNSSGLKGIGTVPAILKPGHQVAVGSTAMCSFLSGVAEVSRVQGQGLYFSPLRKKSKDFRSLLLPEESSTRVMSDHSKFFLRHR